MNNQLNIPKTITVGQQDRSDTYTGKLGYVIYTDEKGVLRKEKSWEGWRDQNIPRLDYDNVPIEGFVFNRHGGGKNSGWGWDDRNSFVRVWDPRGYEFEISLGNMLFILEYCSSIKGKGIEGEMVYAWEGTNLMLLPTNCPQYQNSLEFTDLKSLKIQAKDLILGATYLTKDQRKVVYLGKHNYLTIDYGNFINKEFVFYYEESDDKQNKFITLKVKELAKVLDPELISNFSDLIEEAHTSNFIGPFDFYLDKLTYNNNYINQEYHKYSCFKNVIQTKSDGSLVYGRLWVVCNKSGNYVYSRSYKFLGIVFEVIGTLSIDNGILIQKETKKPEKIENSYWRNSEDNSFLDKAFKMSKEEFYNMEFQELCINKNNKKIIIQL